ncbi:MAG: GatB/YqeY domain-containing protein [Candidatus Omnitrophota bacterium]
MLEERILNDYKEAMKNRDALKSSVLSFLRAAMMNSAIEKKKKLLDDDEVIAVIKKQLKQRQDSIEQFKKGNRQELADKETKEAAILESYLPEQLSPEEVAGAVEEAIAATGASGPKDMGKVMKEVVSRFGASLDARLLSELVRKRLSGG